MKNTENMKSPIFKEVPLLGQSLMQRLLKQLPEENAIIELNNLLATNLVKDISRDTINTLSHKYKINLIEKFSLNLEEFYAVMLNFFFRDRHLSKEEIDDDLNHLRQIFDLNDKNISDIHVKIGEKIFREHFGNTIVKGRLTNEDRNDLMELEKTLGLSKDLTNEISQSISKSFFDKVYNETIKKNRVNPEQERELFAIAKSFDINIPQSYKIILERFKLYWIYENAKLDDVETEVKLQKSEVCFFIEDNVGWYEERELLKRRYGYSKFNSQNKIITQNLKNIDIGCLLLTNKRLIFRGLDKVTSINYDKIISISEFKDSIEVDKQTGRSPILHFSQNADIIYILLNRLLKEFANLVS
jgi:hypothetical protein